MSQENRRLTNWVKWITYPPTHILKVNPSCTSLKTTKLWSKWLSKDDAQQWDMFPEPTELRLIGCSTESTWNRRSKSNMLTPKPSCWRSNQREFFAWRVEPSSCAQHMSFSISSCSHFTNFLSDPIGKQSAMSKRGQEGTSSEGSPMAKPKPMDPAKARPVNLALRSPWSARENPPQDLGYPVNPENDGEGQTGSNSKNRFSKHEIHEPSVHDEGLPFPTKEVGNYSRLLKMSVEASETNVLICGMFMSSSMKEAIHLGPIMLRGNSELVQYHTEIDIGAFWRNSECEYDWQCISLMDEIRIVSWSSDPVDKSKSSCLLRFLSMLGEDEWQQRCNYKMGRSSGRIHNVLF